MIEKVSTYDGIVHNAQLFVEWSQTCLEYEHHFGALKGSTTFTYHRSL